MINDPLYICIQYNKELDISFDYDNKFIKLTPIYHQPNHLHLFCFQMFFKFIKYERATTNYYPYKLEYIDNENKKIYLRFPTLSYQKALKYRCYYYFANINNITNSSIEFIHSIEDLKIDIIKCSFRDIHVEFKSHNNMNIMTFSLLHDIYNDYIDNNGIIHYKREIISISDNSFIQLLIKERKSKDIKQQPEYILQQFIPFHFTNKETSICSICLDGDTSLYKHPNCIHVFHYDCIKKWIFQGRSQITCPNCRTSWN